MSKKSFLQFVVGLVFLFKPAFPAWSAIQVSGSYVNVHSDSSGAELGAAWLIPPAPERGFWAGPKLGASWAQGSTVRRIDFLMGFEGSLWIVNAVGFGLGIDFVAPSWVSDETQGSSTFSNPLHLRVNPSVSIRLLRFNKEGAWAIRFATPYDTLYRWGIQLGLSLQLSGVTQLGN